MKNLGNFEDRAFGKERRGMGTIKKEKKKDETRRMRERE